MADLRTEGSDVAEVEVKLAAGGFPQNLAPTLSAFANLPGEGTLIFGLDEANGFAASGVYEPAACQAALASVARTALDPPVTLQSTQQVFEGAQVEGAKLVDQPALPLPPTEAVEAAAIGSTVTAGRRAPGARDINSQRIREALTNGPMTLEEIVTATGLSNRQASYALEGLRSDKSVELMGGQGVRSSQYRLLN